MIVRIIVSGLALLVAALVLPGIQVDWGRDPTRAAAILAGLAVLFGLVAWLLRPRHPLFTWPARVLTLGLYPVLVDAALLLLVAGLVDAVWDPVLTVGGFPPDLGLEAVAWAVAGAVIIIAVTSVMRLLIPEA